MTWCSFGTFSSVKTTGGAALLNSRLGGGDDKNAWIPIRVRPSQHFFKWQHSSLKWRQQSWVGHTVAITLGLALSRFLGSTFHSALITHWAALGHSLSCNLTQIIGMCHSWERPALGEKGVEHGHRPKEGSSPIGTVKEEPLGPTRAMEEQAGGRPTGMLAPYETMTSSGVMASSGVGTGKQARGEGIKRPQLKEVGGQLGRSNQARGLGRLRASWRLGR